MEKEKSLFEDEKFVSLEEIAEDEIPVVDNEIVLNIDREFSNNVLNGYFNHIYGSKRDSEIAKKFYGIGEEIKNIPDLAKEYSLSCGRVRQIVSKPYVRGWKTRTIQILNLIKTRELSPLENFKKDNWFFDNYGFLFK
jgi:hypothetical protein